MRIAGNQDCTQVHSNKRYGVHCNRQTTLGTLSQSNYVTPYGVLRIPVQRSIIVSPKAIRDTEHEPTPTNAVADAVAIAVHQLQPTPLYLSTLTGGTPYSVPSIPYGGLALLSPTFTKPSPLGPCKLSNPCWAVGEIAALHSTPFAGRHTGHGAIQATL